MRKLIFFLNSKKIKLVSYLSLLGLFSSFCVLFALTVKPIFPVLSFAIMIFIMFAFKEYRIYALVFGVPFTKFLNIKTLGVGSLFSYLIIIYCIIVFLELFFKFRFKLFKNLKLIFICFTLFIISAILTLLFSGFKNIFKLISIFSYIVSISFFYYDTKASKKASTILLSCSVSICITNLIVALFVYILKGETAIHFLEYFTSDLLVKQYQNNNASFRFPGTVGDPNYLGLYSNVILALTILYFPKIKYKFLLIPSLLINLIFSFIGASKNFLIIFCAIILILSIRLITVKIRYGIIGAGIIFSLLIFVLLFGNSLLLPVLSRILFIDTRGGVLNALLTGRLELQQFYLQAFMEDPTTLVFGRGFGGYFYGDGSAHNTFIMSFWYFGIGGSFLFYLYIFNFLLKNRKIVSIKSLPILIIVFYFMSLDLVSYAEIFLILCFLIYEFNSEDKKILTEVISI